MRDELEDNQEDYRSLTHEDWCYLLSTIEVKDNSKRAATQFENISSARAASNSDSDGYVRILSKNKARTGVLRNNKVHNNKSPKHNGNQRHCVICKEAGMPERNYTLHSSEDCFRNQSNQKSIRYGLGVPMGSRYGSVKQQKRSESKWKKELKALKKQNTIIYSIAQKSGAHREIKNINKIMSKATKKHRGDSINYSGDKLDSNYSLSSDSN